MTGYSRAIERSCPVEDNDLDYEEDTDYEPPMKPCPVCGGRGTSFDRLRPCEACDGEGFIENC